MMQIYRTLEDLPDFSAAFVTIGNFDGLHPGHRKIISALREAAGDKPTVAVTFDRAPVEFLNPAAFRGTLFATGEKARALERLGIGHLVMLDFQSVRDLPASVFLESLLRKAGRLSLFVGYNFRFGRHNAGSAFSLKKAAREKGFSLSVIDRVVRAGRTVSSSAIRTLIHRGRVEQACELLGRPYAITAPSEKGDGLGAKIGFPTLNLADNPQVLPASGVYFTLYRRNGRIYPSMTYIGRRPTLKGGNGRIRNETHVLEYDSNPDKIGDCPEHTVFFIRRTRGEKKLRNLEELGKVLYNDRRVILDLYRTYRTGADPQNLLSEEFLCRK